MPTTDPYEEPHPDNLPARRAPLPAVPEPTGPSGVPLRLIPTPTLTFALGYVVTQPVRADQWGGFCALVEELASRFRPRPNSTIPIHEFGALLATLPPEVARSVEMLYRAQRGQRWAATGNRTGQH